MALFTAMLPLCLFVLLLPVLSADQQFLGCYKDVPSYKTELAFQQSDIPNCLASCRQKYYRYAIVQNDGCVCGNLMGIRFGNDSCSHLDCGVECKDLYKTGNLVPGPPQNLRITNITDTSLKISWEPPKSYVSISSYVVHVQILKTYSTYSTITPAWLSPNDTFRTDIITLLPATQYNISLGTTSADGNGAIVSRIIQTKLGDPDCAPEVPEIADITGSRMTVNIPEATNNNGPITSYRLIVQNDDDKDTFLSENVDSYGQAVKNGLSYYIAAELSPQDIKKPFVVGDGRTYGGYLNAPLDPNKNYNVLLGIVSSLDGVTKVRYSMPKQTIVLDIGDISSDNPALIIGLSVAIVLLGCLFIAGLVGFWILRNRVTNRRQRLSDNQELTLQGPMIEVENNGYIHEEEHVPINHYKSLKQKLRTFTPSQLKLEPTNLLGTGKFGRVNSGTILENNTLIPIAAYSIQDKKMNQETRKTMLHELDLLLKTGKHDNIIGLLGTCETSQVVIVALEHLTMNLKDLLLGSRDSLPGKFSNMSEHQALDMAIQICEGMAHLESCKIVHKQLCARSIQISSEHVPKISGYGLAQYYSHNKMPDYTRWTAVEIFRNQAYTSRSDVWSFACLLWEICALGGTPYGSVPDSNDIPERILKGLRLPQLPYFGEELYQVMLDCWQLNLDERPSFATLVSLLGGLGENEFIPFLNFNLYNNFQYEQFYPDMELAVRPIF